MSTKASFDLLDALHSAVAHQLLDKIQTGEATAAEISVAVKFLKDNHIEALAVPDSPISNLLEALPFSDAEIQGSQFKQWQQKSPHNCETLGTSCT